MTVRFTLSTAPAGGGTARYQAPELLLGDGPKTFSSDVYAFACVCYEVHYPRLFFPSMVNSQDTTDIDRKGSISRVGE
jgi:serine/threonine protein kinase